MTKRYRHQWYLQIYEDIPKIHDEARVLAQKMGLEKYRDQVKALDIACKYSGLEEG